MNGESPFAAHFNSHSSSEVARFQTGLFHQHQRQALRIFSNSAEKRFRVGETVLVRTKRPAFYKNSPIFFPSFQPHTYVITSICKQYLPYKYFLERSDDPSIKKRLYAFEMSKTTTESNTVLSSDPLTFNRSNKIHVQDIISRNKTTLRSGKEILGKDIVFYRITVDGKQDIVTEKSLRLLKQALGTDSITYSAFFARENQKYVI